MDTRPGKTRGAEQQAEAASEDTPREQRTRAINEERWEQSVAADAEQAELAKRPQVKEPTGRETEALPLSARDGRDDEEDGEARGDLPHVDVHRTRR